MHDHQHLDETQQPSTTGDMTPGDFRAYAHRVVDWMADYLENIEAYPVLAQTTPGDICHWLPDAPPRQPESMESILIDIDRVMMPGITHWNSPGFLAYFAITGSGPGILGEMISGALECECHAVAHLTSGDGTGTGDTRLAAADAWPATAALWRDK